MFEEKKKGFTLAEVLITLVIIGVVAALGIPALLTQINNADIVAKLKQDVSIFNTVTNEIISDGNLDSIAGNATGLLALINSKVKLIKTCNNSQNDGCWFSDNTFPKMLNGSDFWWTTQGAYPGGVLPNGGYFLVVTGSAFTSCNYQPVSVTSGPLLQTCALVLIDVNGLKPPNMFGRDSFEFYMTKTGFFPYGTYGDRATITPSQFGCTVGADGEGCAVRILKENAINY